MMRTSTRRTSDAGGFTLVEMMITLVIMGMLAGLASLAIGGGAHRQARDEAERLYQLLGYASDEATLQGEEFGLLVEDNAYSFLRFDPADESWQPMPEKQFASHSLPDSVAMDVTLEDQQGLAASAGSTSDGAAAPGILLLSSGEISAFRMSFVSSDSEAPAASISSDGSGTLAWD